MVEGPRFDNVTYDLEDDVLVVAVGGEDQALVACSTWTGGGTAKHRFTSFSNRAPGTAPCRSASRRNGFAHTSGAPCSSFRTRYPGASPRPSGNPLAAVPS